MGTGAPCLLERVILDLGFEWLEEATKGVLGRGISRSEGKMRKCRICSGSYALREGFLFCFASSSSVLFRNN